MTLSPTRSFALVATLIGSLLAASATPTPLYGDYAARWHFSSATLTVVYALYAIGVLTSLIVAGRLSDRIGRRPVLAVALVGLLVAMGMTALVATLSSGSALAFFAASALTGSGLGVAFMGALREVSVAAPAADRGSVMSAFFVVAYLSLSLPAIGAGITATDVGVEPTFRVFGMGVVVLALGLTLTARRRAPAVSPA